MGLEAAVLAPLIFGAASGLGAGALAPSQQERESFRGTSVDPTRQLAGARDALVNTFNTAAGRANEPIDLSGAQVQAPRRLQGGSMPLSVGLTARPPTIGPPRVPLSPISPDRDAPFNPPDLNEIKSRLEETYSRWNPHKPRTVLPANVADIKVPAVAARVADIYSRWNPNKNQNRMDTPARAAARLLLIAHQTGGAT